MAILENSLVIGESTKIIIYQSVSLKLTLYALPWGRILRSMASDGPALESRKQDSEPVDRGVRYRSAFRDRGRDRMFFERVAQSNSVQAALMKSSTIKLDESLKLLAEISDLLRR